MVDHDTSNRALSGVLKYYQKQDRLEADIKLESETYSADTKQVELHVFGKSRTGGEAERGRRKSRASDRLKRLVPVFEEGTVDEDLLNEGNRRLRDYFQRLGYFDVKVDHMRAEPGRVEQSRSLIP